MKSWNDHLKGIFLRSSADEESSNRGHEHGDIEPNQFLSERPVRFSATPSTGWKPGPRVAFANRSRIRDGSSPAIFSNPSSSIILLLVPGPVPESRIQFVLYFSSRRIALRLRGPAKPKEIISLIDS